MAADVWIVAATTLHINDGSTYSCSADFQPSKVSYRRDIIKSPYIEGSFAANTIRDASSQDVSCYVGGIDQATIETNIAALVTVLEYSGFTFHIKLDGTTEYAWQAIGPADYGVTFDHRMTIGRKATVNFTFWRMPQPLAGAV